MKLTDEEIDEWSLYLSRAVTAHFSTGRAKIADALRSALAADRLPHPQADVEARLREIRSNIEKACVDETLMLEDMAWLLALVRDQAVQHHGLREESENYQRGYREGQAAERKRNHLTLQDCLRELRLHNEEYNHVTRQDFITALEKELDK